MPLFIEHHDLDDVDPTEAALIIEHGGVFLPDPNKLVRFELQDGFTTVENDDREGDVDDGKAVDLRVGIINHELAGRVASQIITLTTEKDNDGA